MRTVEACFRGFLDSFDPKYGGFGDVPKFPCLQLKEILIQINKYVLRDMRGDAMGDFYLAKM